METRLSLSLFFVSTTERMHIRQEYIPCLFPFCSCGSIKEKMAVTAATTVYASLAQRLSLFYVLSCVESCVQRIPLATFPFIDFAVVVTVAEQQTPLSSFLSFCICFPFQFYSLFLCKGSISSTSSLSCTSLYCWSLCSKEWMDRELKKFIDRRTIT